MKNIILKKILLSVTIALGLVSCEDRDIVTIDSQSAPIVMDLSSENLVLDANFPKNSALTVTWENSSYTVPVEIKYDLEISVSESFENPIKLVSNTQSQTNASFTVNEINEAAKKIGLIPDESQKMYFRVSSFIGVDDLVQRSNITSINLTPYLASPTYEYQDLFMVGNAAVGHWDNTVGNITLTPLLKTANPNQYTFTGFFKEKSGAETAGFKLIKERGSWDSQFGAGTAAGTLSNDGGSGNLSVPADGYYKLTVDTASLTYTLVPVSAPITTYTTISIIGTVNGDDFVSDKQLTQSTFDPHLWSVSNVELSAGEFKFRANNAWDTSWGTNAEYFGTATKGGANIPLAAEWKYDIYFNDATGDYSIIPIK